ncbi:MAG: glycoside hydrolase family 38 N-terminal domain-containing protein [Pirellulales bacterium]
MRLPLAFAPFALALALAPLQAAENNAAEPAPAADAGLRDVVIVYKTHFDIGYTTMAREVVHAYRTEMADRVLDAIEINRNQPKEQQFVWTVSGWPMKQILWEGQTPERRRKLEQAIREGNLVVHAYPFTTHTETAEPEDLVRGLGISSALDRQFGLPLSTGAKMSDVPGQSWIFPTLFAHAGIKFYHMGGPLVNRTFNLPPMFWWEGPDGSRLLTLYNNGYGSAPLPPDGWPYRTWIYISMTGDNQGPPDPGTVKRDIEFYRARGINAKVGKLDDFAALILREDLSKLPVVRSDIPDPWIHGMLSMPAACKLAHNIRPVIGAMDQLTTLERCWGIFRPDLRPAVAAAYDQSLRFSEHTWGLANQHYVKQPYGKAWDELWSRGLPPQYQVMEQSWREKAGSIDDVQRLVAGPYEDALLTLADQVNVPGGRIVVFNPLPWTRAGEVTLNAFELPHGVSLRPVDGGPLVPISQEGPAVEDPYRIIRFQATDVPPLGYRTYTVSAEKPAPVQLVADEKAGVIESPFFKAVLDAKRGRIASLIDKRTGRELVDAAAPQGFGQYFYERFGYKQLADWTAKSLYPQYTAHQMMFSAFDMPRDAVYASALPENMTLAVNRTAIDSSAVMTGTIPGPGQPQQVFIRLTLPAALPVADLEIGWQKQPDGWPEAGWICLPFRCDRPKFRLGRLGADVDPVKDVTVENANYHLSWVNTGVAVYDGQTGAGVAICPQDSPLVSLGEPGEYKFDPRYEPAKPYVYVNLYNNHWRTNFAGWIGDGGRMTSRVRLWAFDKFSPEAALYSPAMEARVPLAAARSTARPGKLPPAQPGIGLSRKGVAVTAFGPNPDGAGIVLRVWEQGGAGGKLTVTLPSGAALKLATPVTLRGEKIGAPIKIADGKLTFTLPAYAPASYLLSP